MLMRRPTRRVLFPIAAVVAVLVAPGLSANGEEQGAGTAPARPNVVIILADDLGWGDVGFNGRTEWATPNLDALASRGLKLERCYTGAVVCAPSRAALMTGRSTIHNGVSANDADLPASETTLAEALKAQGYRTALFGKWHHGKPRAGEVLPAPSESLGYVHPMDQGFDEFYGYTDAVHAWEKFPTELWNGREKVPAAGYADDLFTDRAIDFIHRSKDAPFLLYLPLVATHFHVEAPADEVARHRGRFPEKDNSEPLNATYAAMATRLDSQVGRVVEAIQAEGLTEKTLLIFTSDHGATFESGNRGASNALDSNRPFRGQKRTLWEGGIRVPGVVVWPGTIPAGSVSRTPTSLLDIFPTALAAAGGSPDPSLKLDGLNQLDHWLGKAPNAERTLFWEWRSEGSSQLAAMSGDLKLVISPGNRPELFDVVADPAERRNIAAEKPKVVQRLRAELDAWLATEARP